MNLITRSINHIGTAYVRYKCRREYSNQVYFGLNERPIELAFLFKHIIGIAPKSVLDVGTGVTALPQMLRNCGYLVTAIDNVRDYWPFGMVNRHYHVINDDILNPTISETFDLITCISVIEHIPDHRRAISSMWRLLNKNGYLIITCPYSEKNYIENVYKLQESSMAGKLANFSTQSFSRAELTSWLQDTDFRIEDQEYWNFFTGAFWTCGERLTPPVKSTESDPHQLICLLLRKS